MTRRTNYIATVSIYATHIRGQTGCQNSQTRATTRSKETVHARKLDMTEQRQNDLAKATSVSTTQARNDARAISQ